MTDQRTTLSFLLGVSEGKNQKSEHRIAVMMIRLRAPRLGDILAMLAGMIVVGGTWPTITPGSARRFWASRLEDGLAEKYLFG